MKIAKKTAITIVVNLIKFEIFFEEVLVNQFNKK